MNDLYLVHYGIKGMKWGVRKQQQLTNRANRYRMMATLNGRAAANAPRPIAFANRYNEKYYTKKANKVQTKIDRMNDPKVKAQRKGRVKKAAIIGGVVAGTALATYGAYKANKAMTNNRIKIAEHYISKQLKNEASNGYWHNRAPLSNNELVNMGKSIVRGGNEGLNKRFLHDINLAREHASKPGANSKKEATKMIINAVNYNKRNRMHLITGKNINKKG